MESSAGEITRLLGAWAEGDESAFEELARRIHPVFRRIAAYYMKLERRPAHTLQPTELVTEAYKRFLTTLRNSQQTWARKIPEDEAGLISLFSVIMQQSLTDHSRKRKKRGEKKRVPFDEAERVEAGSGTATMKFVRAFKALRVEYPLPARVVELHHIAGWSLKRTSQALEISTATVSRCSTLARAFIYSRMKNDF